MADAIPLLVGTKSACCSLGGVAAQRSPSTRPRYAVAWMLGTLIWAASSLVGAAETRDPAAAAELFDSAKEALARGDVDTACGRFQESWRLDPAVGTLLNLGDCEEHRGHLAEAWRCYKDARGQLVPGDFREAFTERKIAEIDRRVARLTVRVRGDARNVRVFRDGVELRGASLDAEMPVDPTSHGIELIGPNGKKKVSIRLAEGERRTVDLEVDSAMARDASTASSGGPAISHPAPRPSSLKNWAYASMAAGAAGLAMGVIAGWMTKTAADTYKSECDSGGKCTQDGVDAANRGRITEVLSPIGVGIGLVGLGVGTYLLVSPPKTGGVAASQTGAPWGGAVVSVSGTF